MKQLRLKTTGEICKEIMLHHAENLNKNEQAWPEIKI